MTPLSESLAQLAEAQSVLRALVADQHRRLVAGIGLPLPLAYVQTIHAARREVRRLEAVVRAGRVEQVELIADARLT